MSNAGVTRRVDHVLQTFQFGDAISDIAVFARDALRANGLRSNIYAENIGRDVANDAFPFSTRALRDTDAIIYHYAIGSKMTAAVKRLRAPKALAYHNITPPEFFEPYDAHFADVLRLGRDDLVGLAPSFDLLVADSQYNADELSTLTRRDVEVVPVAFDERRFASASDPIISSRARPGAQWLMVGRIAPNKGLVRLIDAFAAFLTWDSEAALTIVGRYTASDPFYQQLRAQVAALGLHGRVLFAGSVSESALRAWYETSNVFVSLSEHEGFCVPLIEAMMFDLPIVASATSAIPETLGASGLLVSNEAGPREIAGIIAVLLADADIRGVLIAAQRERRRAFRAEVVLPILTRTVSHLLNGRARGT